MPNYLLMIITAVIYVALVYFNGWHSNMASNLTLLKFAIITPILRSPSNCTVAYEFRGSTIALRNDDAKYIYIE